MENKDKYVIVFECDCGYSKEIDDILKLDKENNESYQEVICDDCLRISKFYLRKKN